MALGKTLYELENSISYSELQEWSEYLGLYPLHEDRNEMQLAVLSQIHTSSKEHKTKARDFMISHQHDERSLSDLSGEELNDYILKVMS